MTDLQQGKCSPSRDAPDTAADSICTSLVRQWAEPILLQANRFGPVPLPGTAAWHALPNDDPRKRAAVIYAALWWCEQHTPAALAERAEVAVYLDHSAQRQASIAVSLAQEWANGNPTHAELLRRRAVYIERPPIDRTALRRWVETGSSEPEESAA